jgi:hypothetical protein
LLFYFPPLQRTYAFEHLDPESGQAAEVNIPSQLQPSKQSYAETLIVE